jgi:hypothetical protein
MSKAYDHKVECDFFRPRWGRILDFQGDGFKWLWHGS